MSKINLGKVVGDDGKSAYQIWLEQGNTGTEQDFIESLIGQEGTPGQDGRGISKIEKTSTVGLIDTYTITYTDGTTSTYEVKNGANGSGEGGTSDYTALENLPSINGVTLLGNKTTKDLGIEISGGNTDTEIEANFPADVLMIPCYGQSLSCNTSAGTSTFKSTYPLIYDKNLNNTNIQDMSAGTAEGFKIAADYYGVELPENLKIVSSVDGAGGISVAGLSKGTSYYNKLIASVQTCKNNCDAQGLTMNVPCFTWTQGEEDMRCGGDDSKYGSGNWDPFKYKDRLKKLIDDLNTDIKAITGQTNDVLCVSYQTGSHTCYARYPRIAMQQVDLSKEDSRMVLAKVMYDVDYSTADYVHAPARTYRNMGNLYGVAIFESCILNKKFQPTQPLYHVVKGNQIYIRFNAPTKPLRFDTTLINQLPDKNYGFNVYNVEELSGAAGTIVESETRITNVQIISDDTVIITLNQEPQKNDRLTYAINGDYWQNIAGDKVITTGGEGEDGISKSGWQYGSRGCLRDSSKLRNNNSGAVFTKLYNWCPIFEIDLTPTATGPSVITYTWNDDLIITGNSNITSLAQEIPLTATCTATGSDGSIKVENNPAYYNWSSDNEDIATVVNGVVTMSENKATETRSVTITATLKVDPEIKNTFEITQGAYVEYIWNNDLTITGETNVSHSAQNIVLNVNCTASGSDGTTIAEANPLAYHWSSNNTSIATVDNGIVSILVNTTDIERSVTITATLKADTSITRTHTITQAMYEEDEVDTFVETVSVSAETESKLRTLVDTLKSEGIWSKIKGIYPMVGRSVTDMAYNLKDVNSYKINLSTLATMGTDGLIVSKDTSSNNTTISGPTYSKNSWHLIYSTDDDLTAKPSVNLIHTAASAGTATGSSKTVCVITQTNKITQRNSTTVKEEFAYEFVSGTNYTIGVTSAHKAIINGEILSPDSEAVWSMTEEGADINVGSYVAGNWTKAMISGSQIFFLGFGDELTKSELEAYSTAINAFKQKY